MSDSCQRCCQRHVHLTPFSVFFFYSLVLSGFIHDYFGSTLADSGSQFQDGARLALVPGFLDGSESLEENCAHSVIPQCIGLLWQPTGIVKISIKMTSDPR